MSQPNAYRFPVHAGFEYLCPACYLETITSPPDPDDIFGPDFTPTERNGDERVYCYGCNVSIPEPEDAP